MTKKSAAELEREAEATRARVVATAESIRDKMTPGQLVDELAGLFSGGAGAEMLANLKAQVRDNPLPLTVIGAGLAWLMLGSGASAAAASPGYATRRSSGQRDGASGSGMAMTSDTSASAGEMAGGAAGTFSGMASSAANTMSDMASDAAGTVSDIASGTAQTLANSAAATADMATQAGRSAQQLMEDQPLALAAVGLAIGAAIGAMLPHTQVEDERLGGYREQLRDKAEDALEEGVDQVKQVAAEVYQTASEEAGRQASKEGTLADKDVTSLSVSIFAVTGTPRFTVTHSWKFARTAPPWRVTVLWHHWGGPLWVAPY
ncbi:DUF3618 domain-containing protein [Mesorhizobium sp. M1C.F.Ca.ET.193.01.1.1]|uniref:DUF3618 domain-containing protein n=2 Tax=Mesorhizobium TaxID=68287 RepID=UPI000FD5CF52|nr:MULTISPECIES: DUF3618 domain-containing protein [unclassified Mesorhizobium]TGS94425.1 DUF3618 domain-containing protein [bacterium M00.F.Ca.ET.177.01.1.1]TGQ51571.1 DUF3618 domain-containing protein [Mesorhizobium sp. M1C.F.Ca.ET.210.01.1.1]TGQ67799.1 DUF3618 domain-containing protein [Mesorhizobium sp. M1C.F.Ca.ET.212.01.1.1]TGR02392.1 DUF3618 domain-containing protein [Mesorhizobium sp. M1C.F.Ca.ET.204.01.1.1]TGR22934.1 DUF3618 domain-containing protein [Mesorhizobium sp. M1C.F.Ca.ET.196